MPNVTGELVPTLPRSESGADHSDEEDEDWTVASFPAGLREHGYGTSLEGLMSRMWAN
ncbi:MAG: hypothetical protein J6386_10515 [Candidatus Synoicihabitans palmerolidicus]|nr:hypothetical protein [Candidatus Synoicihabitans palmerolidicus]